MHKKKLNYLGIYLKINVISNATLCNTHKQFGV